MQIFVKNSLQFKDLTSLQSLRLRCLANAFHPLETMQGELRPSNERTSLLFPKAHLHGGAIPEIPACQICCAKTGNGRFPMKSWGQSKQILPSDFLSELRVTGLRELPGRKAKQASVTHHSIHGHVAFKNLQASPSTLLQTEEIASALLRLSGFPRLSEVVNCVNTSIPALQEGEKSHKTYLKRWQQWHC